MALVPLLTLFHDLGIANWYVGIWLAHTAFGLPLGIFLLRNFFITLPRDLIEAARVDGASNFRIFLKVVLPLSVPALAAYGIFQFLWVWNDLLMALIFVQNSDLLPMTMRINQMQSTYGDRVAPPERRRVPADDRAADRLLRAPALLRAGPARRLR